MINDALPAVVGSFIQRLFLLTRPITGVGNRKTLRVLQGIAPIEMDELTIGPLFYDWGMSDGWSIWDMSIMGTCGKRLEAAS